MIGRNSALSFLIKFCYAAIQFATVAIIAQYYGSEALGKVALFLSASAVLSILLQFGTPTWILKEVSRTNWRERILVASERISQAMTLVISLTSILMIFLFLLSILPLSFELKDALAIVIMSLTLAVLAMLSGLMRGNGNVIAAQIPDQVIRPAISLIVVITLLVYNVSISSSGLIFIFLATAALAAIVQIAVAKIKLPGINFRISRVAEMKIAFFESSPFLFVSGIFILNSNTDLLMLGVLSGPSEAGLYKPAAQISEGLNMVVTAISMPLAPIVSKLYSENRWPEIGNLTKKIHLMTFLIILPLTIIITYFSREMLELFFGDTFKDSSLALNILVSAKAMNALVAFSGLVLTMTMGARQAAIIAATGLFVNLALNAFLIPSMGAAGAAIATAISLVWINVINAIYIFNRTGVILVGGFPKSN
ncbi:Polysaccharide biosynthesis protein (plasmid) [Roseivivax sp. THAF40]|uniref:oligosaccharide flippase family protein n=1 Tax=Roseivivax sp. THAF40 TaxID=2587858 RepID=UPI0012682D51|nr:oligosaccharide flippase family protein [Roseivivax sp. THAF40]QFT48741.1 Polysaccharide biosynthesis protein [Roseivivax sp. THAF40]